jgi:hypothetical protein
MPHKQAGYMTAPDPQSSNMAKITLSNRRRPDMTTPAISVGSVANFLPDLQPVWSCHRSGPTMSSRLSFPIMVDFKGSHYPKQLILYAVFFYVRYAISYRDLEEIMAERGVAVDHATLNR